jgi:hypothetical protein
MEASDHLHAAVAFTPGGKTPVSLDILNKMRIS